MQEPLYVQWKQWNCRSDCQYFCMMQQEKEREALGLKPVKYHGKWPFKRSSVLQVSRSFNAELNSIHQSATDVTNLFFVFFMACL